MAKFGVFKVEKKQSGDNNPNLKLVYRPANKDERVLDGLKEGEENDRPAFFYDEEQAMQFIDFMPSSIRDSNYFVILKMHY